MLISLSRQHDLSRISPIENVANVTQQMLTMPMAIALVVKRSGFSDISRAQSKNVLTR